MACVSHRHHAAVDEQQNAGNVDRIVGTRNRIAEATWSARSRRFNIASRDAGVGSSPTRGTISQIQRGTARGRAGGRRKLPNKAGIEAFRILLI
jgi:hypothetical protein